MNVGEVEEERRGEAVVCEKLDFLLPAPKVPSLHIFVSWRQVIPNRERRRKEGMDNRRDLGLRHVDADAVANQVRTDEADSDRSLQLYVWVRCGIDPKAIRVSSSQMM